MKIAPCDNLGYYKNVLVIYLLNSCLFSQLSQLIVNAGGVAAVIDYIGETHGNVRLPGVMMLGYVGAHSENLAMSVIVSKVSFVFFFLEHFY